MRRFAGRKCRMDLFCILPRYIEIRYRHFSAGFYYIIFRDGVGLLCADWFSVWGRTVLAAFVVAVSGFKQLICTNPAYTETTIQNVGICRYQVSANIRHGTGSHFVTKRPGDPGIQRPGDPVDAVTLFYNELQMSTYVADKRLQWARGLPVFIAVWSLNASGK